jgi:hypothetical protein
MGVVRRSAAQAVSDSNCGIDHWNVVHDEPGRDSVLASRELCREVDEDFVRSDTYVSGEKVSFKHVYDLKEDPDRLADFILDEQPWVIVKKLAQRYGPIIRWQGVLGKSPELGIPNIDM